MSLLLLPAVLSGRRDQYENWNNFKAAEEFLKLYPESKNDPTDILCDDCNEKFKAWFATLTDEQKKKMRDDFEKNKGYHVVCACCDKSHFGKQIYNDWLKDYVCEECENEIKMGKL